MAAMTVAEAVTRVQTDLLDDKNGRRWDATQVQRHLRAALSKCLSTYSKEGGRRFVRKLSSQATTSAGVLDLSSHDPLIVLSTVLVDGDNRRERLGQCEPWEIEYVDDQARTVDVHLVPNIAWSAAGDLVPTDSTVPGTFDAFDEWVCAKAARDAAVKDKALHRALEVVEADAHAAAVGWPDANPSPDFPQKVGAYEWIRWSVVGKNLQLCRNYGHDWSP